jgi:hypothetical protein
MKYYRSFTKRWRKKRGGNRSAVVHAKLPSRVHKPPRVIIDNVETVLFPVVEKTSKSKPSVERKTSRRQQGLSPENSGLPDSSQSKTRSKRNGLK